MCKLDSFQHEIKLFQNLNHFLLFIIPVFLLNSWETKQLKLSTQLSEGEKKQTIPTKKPTPLSLDSQNPANVLRKIKLFSVM